MNEYTGGVIMFHYNKMIISWFLIFSLFSFAKAEETKNHSGPYRPSSPELAMADFNELSGMDGTAFSKLSLDAPSLKRAYLFVFSTAGSGPLYFKQPELTAALSDMRRRGDSVTPMLIKLMNENHETGFEMCVLMRISRVGNIEMEPYLEYSRELLRERTQTMNAGLAEVASMLLSSKGTEEDIELLKWVIETRPYVAAPVSRELGHLKRRFGLPKPELRPPLRGSPSPSGSPTGDSRSDRQQRPTVTAEKEQESIRWVAWFLVILVAGGLCRMFLKKRK